MCICKFVNLQTCRFAILIQQPKRFQTNFRFGTEANHFSYNVHFANIIQQASQPASKVEQHLILKAALCSSFKEMEMALHRTLGRIWKWKRWMQTCLHQKQWKNQVEVMSQDQLLDGHPPLGHTLEFLCTADISKDSSCLLKFDLKFEISISNLILNLKFEIQD